jgi:hypothetical protein
VIEEFERGNERITSFSDRFQRKTIRSSTAKSPRSGCNPRLWLRWTNFLPLINLVFASLRKVISSQIDYPDHKHDQRKDLGKAEHLHSMHQAQEWASSAGFQYYTRCRSGGRWSLVRYEMSPKGRWDSMARRTGGGMACEDCPSTGARSRETEPGMNRGSSAST